MILDILTYKPNLFKEIFAKDESGKYTNKAQRRQHIINFFLKDESRFFKMSEIQNILFEVPEIFDVDLTLNHRDIKHNQYHQFDVRLKELKSSQLIVSEKTQSSEPLSDAKKYKLTKFGKTIALIIEFIFSDKKQENYDKMYQYWKSYLSGNPTSLNLFCLAYLDKCKDRGFFNTFVDFFVDNVINRNQYIRNNHELFTQLILVRFEDKKENKALYELWRNVFQELDEKTRKLFLNHLSIHINRIIASKVHDFARFELKRYERRYSNDCIISEFNCSVCQSFYEYVEIAVFSYLSYSLGNPNFIIKKILDELKCRNCHTNGFKMTIF